MASRVFMLVLVTICCIGIAIAFLWVQVGLPPDITDSPWDPSIHLFPSIYAFWIPLIYLFFTSIWMVLCRKESSVEARFFLKLDYYSYTVVPIFFLLQVAWREFDSPVFWLRGFVLAVLLLKSFLLFRMLYRCPQCIQPTLLVVLGVGLHIFLFPFAYPKLALSLTDVFQRKELLQLAMVIMKSLCLNLMTLEMFRLGREMAKSGQSAFFSWIVVTFTFPIIGFPRMSYILAGLLIIFILRMIFSRLNTQELMLGLLTPTNIMILLKLLVIFALLTVAGLIFWSNVKPGFEVRSGRAFQAVIGTLFDGQFGLLCYAPMYWLAFLGGMYLVFFKVWDGISLIITGGILYLGYHFAVYGILGRIIEQSDAVLFLPILGVFIAIAHDRFGKMVLFRTGIRLAAIATAGITMLFILRYPDFPSIPDKIAEIQRAVTTALGKDLTYLFPSTVFRLLPFSFFLWIGGIGGVALFFCQSRTRSASIHVGKTKRILEHHFHVRELTFPPFLVVMFLLMGFLVIRYGNDTHSIPINQPVSLSSSQEQEEILLHNSFRSKGLLVVSNLAGSLTLPDKTPVASVIVLGQDQRFESSNLKAGKDTSEETLERPAVKNMILHRRAAIYRSWKVEPEQETPFMAHEYYTKFLFSRPLEVQKITIKFLGVSHEDLPSDLALHIKEIILLN